MARSGGPTSAGSRENSKRAGRRLLIKWMGTQSIADGRPYSHTGPARPGQRPRKMPTGPELTTSLRHGVTPAMQEEQQ